MTDLPDYACQSNQLSCNVLRDEIERLRDLIRELAGAQDTMALLVARGPEWSGYQQAMDKAALRRANAIIALCEEVRP